jgi:hypothetical protein
VVANNVIVSITATVPVAVCRATKPEGEMMARTKAFADKYLERFMSRKLLVWISTTALLLTEYVNSEQWVAIALAYIGSQGVADIAVAWKTGQLLTKDK